LDHLGLALAIKEHCDALSALHPQLQIVLEADNVPRGIPSDVALCLFRIVQEALGNIVMHSGAHKAQITLGTHAQDITLSVEDDGCGFDVERALVEGGLGLVSMRERLRLIGGSMSICSRPCAGTRLEARAPARFPRKAEGAVPQSESFRKP
jgi:signal transduction histidine kinase